MSLLIDLVFKAQGKNIKKVDAVTHQVRIEKCRDCEHLIGLNCGLCGCFVNDKAKYAMQECPIGKWKAELNG